MPRKEIVTYTHCREISRKSIEKYIEAFDMLSENEKISATDITKILKYFGYYISIEEVKEMIKEYDLNEDCELDLEGYIDFMDKYEQNHEKMKIEKNDVIDAFDY